MQLSNILSFILNIAFNQKCIPMGGARIALIHGASLNNKYDNKNNEGIMSILLCFLSPLVFGANCHIAITLCMERSILFSGSGGIHWWNQKVCKRFFLCITLFRFSIFCPFWSLPSVSVQRCLLYRERLWQNEYAVRFEFQQISARKYDAYQCLWILHSEQCIRSYERSEWFLLQHVITLRFSSLFDIFFLFFFFVYSIIPTSYC